MEKVYIEEKYIPEYVGDMLSGLKCGTEQVSNTNAKFHHNTDYEQVPSVIKYGILSLQKLNKLGLKNYSEKLLKLMSNIDSHVNGDTGISLSVTGLEDLYLDEDEFNPTDMYVTDILVSSEVKAARISINYGNEYVAQDRIAPDMFRAVDIRLLNYLKAIIEKGSRVGFQNIEGLVMRYNYLRSMAIALQENKLQVPFREMSEGIDDLDIDKVAKVPTLVIKK